MKVLDWMEPPAPAGGRQGYGIPGNNYELYLSFLVSCLALLRELNTTERC